MWEKLGEGTFNVAYVNEDKTKVFKVQKSLGPQGYVPPTDGPERSARLWNEINHNYPPPAYLHTDNDSVPPKTGWVCPFIKGKNASDREIGNALLDIFNRTGRIVLDAYVPGNFKKDEKGNIACVDIGMAFQLQQQEEAFFAQYQRQRGTRPASMISNSEWRRGYDKIYSTFPFIPTIIASNTVNTTKALLFIKMNRPDIYNVDFLKSDKSMIKKLAAAYDESVNPSSPQPNHEVISAAKQILTHEKPISMNQLKESCKAELERYINSRGTLNLDGEFSPSFRTKFFRNQTLTAKKVDVAKELLQELDDANSPEDIQLAIQRIKEDPELISQGVIADELLNRINKCSFIIDNVSEFNLTASNSQALTH